MTSAWVLAAKQTIAKGENHDATQRTHDVQKEDDTMALTRNAANPAAPAGPPRSRYAGISCADTRDPMLSLGRYRVRVIGAAVGKNPGKGGRESYKTTLQVVETYEGDTPAGATATMVNFYSSAGLAELKRFAVHAAGFGPTLAMLDGDAAPVKDALVEGEEAYDVLDVDGGGYEGAIIEATSGVANNAPSLVGRLVDVIVSQGNPVMVAGVPTGDYYRVYRWGAVPDEEQDA